MGKQGKSSKEAVSKKNTSDQKATGGMAASKADKNSDSNDGKHDNQDDDSLKCNKKGPTPPRRVLRGYRIDYQKLCASKTFSGFQCH